MRRTRFMTWFFLSISIALLCVRSFRPALEAPLTALLPDDWVGEFGAAESARNNYFEGDQTGLQVALLSLGTGRILERLFSLRRYITPDELRQKARDAEPSGDSEFMAFAALHLPPDMCEEALHLTDRVVAANPKMTWLIYHAAAHCRSDWKGPRAKAWQAEGEKLEAWDPDNGAARFLRAELIRSGEGWDFGAAVADPDRIQETLNHHLDWQNKMQEVFVQPRFDIYYPQRFLLDRHVMLARGWDDPVLMSCLFSNLGLGIYSLHQYSDLEVRRIGAIAEAQGRINDALRDYRTVARFGERMTVSSSVDFLRLIGTSIQRQADERLVPALKKAGKVDEAAALEFAENQQMNEIHRLFGDPTHQSSNHSWSVVLAGVTGTGVWVFLFLSLASILYVNAKLWIRRDKKGRLYQLMTVLENYAPLVLFANCLVLGLTYAPYAQNSSYYMTATKPPVDWVWALDNFYPSPRNLGRADSPIENPYHGYVSFALAIAGVFIVAALIRNRLATRSESKG